MNQAITQLISDLDNTDPHIRFAAARTLGDVGAQYSDLPENILHALLAALKDTTWFVRLAALQSVKELQIEPALVLQNIRPLLTDEHEDIREYAALTIGDLGSAAVPAVSALCDALSDSVWYVRSSVAQVLGKIGPAAQTACPFLIHCLEDVEIEVRIAAVTALGRMCTTDAEQVVIALQNIVDQGAQPSVIRDKAGEALLQRENLHRP